VTKPESERQFLSEGGLPFVQKDSAFNYTSYSRILQPTIPVEMIGMEYRFGRIQHVGTGAAVTWLSELPPAGFQDVYYNVTASVTAGDAFILDKLQANGPASPFRSALSRFTVGASV